MKSRFPVLKMASPESTRIVLGVFAATGVVVITYLLLKKFGPKKKDNSFPETSGDGLEATKPKETEPAQPTQASKESVQEELQSEVSSLASQEPTGKASEPDVVPDQSDVCADPLTQDCQSSFFAIDGGYNLANSSLTINTENGVGSGRKSDRSSDESSYDVIEDEAIEEVVSEEERKDAPEIVEGASQEEVSLEGTREEGKLTDQESFQDANETSMVMVENVEKSGSSYYTSADESVEMPSEKQNESADKDVSEQEERESPKDDKKEDLEASVTDNEKTLVPSTSSVSENAELNDAGGPQVTESKGQGEESVGPATLGGEEEKRQESMSSSMEMSSWQDVGADVEIVKGDEQQEVAAEDVSQNAQVLPITDAVLSAEIGAAADNEDEEAATQEPSSEEVTRVLSLCQSSPAQLSQQDVEVLVSILSRPDTGLVPTVLDSLVRVSAFTQHNPKLRASRCPQVVTALTTEKCQELVQGKVGSETMLQALCQVVTNFSLDPTTQALMEDSIPALVDVFSLDTTSEALQLSLLRPLINFSSEATYHSYYTGLVPRLFSLLDSGSPAVRVQSLKVLVNLSLDKDLVPNLLAAKAPSCLLELLDLPTSNDIILRVVTLLANMEQSLQDEPRAPLALPVEEKVESPLTLHTALRGVTQLPHLRNKVFRLTRHDDEDVVYQASRLYKLITSTTK
ncbi:uncharacterized protein LOC101864094 [Aplysia californica]|uniref:Uncharacterized protein LOC101864094 n=1 Tax=Aplysia californica TaxID=6500 RepID=A0ABM1W0W5_APLCA|nr:uncharacterized protein LOC101864094 [Aplysia californica]